METLAHLVFRNLDGSFTLSGWYWLVLSTLVFAASLLILAVPRVICRGVRLQGIRHATLVVCMLTVATAGMAVWFGLMAITAAPGQLL